MRKRFESNAYAASCIADRHERYLYTAKSGVKSSSCPGKLQSKELSL